MTPQLLTRKTGKERDAIFCGGCFNGVAQGCGKIGLGRKKPLHSTPADQKGLRQHGFDLVYYAKPYFHTSGRIFQVRFCSSRYTGLPARLAKSFRHYPYVPYLQASPSHFHPLTLHPKIKAQTFRDPNELNQAHASTQMQRAQRNEKFRLFPNTSSSEKRVCWIYN
jgi:hypothetical protein